MSEPTPTKKVLKTQFLIRNAAEAAPPPTTPVKIAPPPVSLRRSKSLKTERTKFKRYVSAPGGFNTTDNSDLSLTLPRNFTTTSNLKTKLEAQKLDSVTLETKLEAQKTDSVTLERVENGKGNLDDSNNENKLEVKPEKENTNETKTVNDDIKDIKLKNGVEKRLKQQAKMPVPATWQTVVNTHRRGSSMTFVSTQNWAQFDKVVENETKIRDFDWDIKINTWEEYEAKFHEIKPLHGFISGKQAKEFLSKTNIPTEQLVNIWNLADMDHDGSLSLVEFAVAMHCVSAVQHGTALPGTVPASLRDSLIYHINSKNNMLYCLKANDTPGKSPEKSALKSCDSTPKGTTVTFKDDSSCDTLPRSRPRPSKNRLVTTSGAALHLRPQCIHSSSEFYSTSDISTGDSDNDSSIEKASDMSDEQQDIVKKEKKRDKKDHKKKTKKSKSHNGHHNEGVSYSSGTEPSKKPIRSERTYDDIDDFRTKLDVGENDEDAEALIASSDEEDHKLMGMACSMPPPSAPAPKRTTSVHLSFGAPRRPPPPKSSSSSSPSSPANLPPSSPPPSRSPPPSCSLPSELPTSSAQPEETELTTSDGGSVHHDPSGYEILAEDSAHHAPVTIVMDNGEVISSDSDKEVCTFGELHKSVITESEENLLAVARKRNRGLSLDSHISVKDTDVGDLDTCFDSIPAPGDACTIYGGFRLSAAADDFVADTEELMSDIRPEHDKLAINLNEAERSDIDIDKLKEKDLEELRSTIRDYELHNKALLNITRELKIELIKVKEHKFQLLNTLESMKKV